ncbi:protein-glutamate O-methyltransferase CheR [Myxococcota bacterium]|nr:protein-glutamate O-methyltransferase CheR [Myxococcota bacterium]MBU1537838.1 protein-glutamate O-methyltransferase CheR [Myxococcota bacterium]
MSIDSGAIARLLAAVEKNTGTDLTGYRRSTLARRLARRLLTLGLKEEAYVQLCTDNTLECQSFIAEVTVNVSSFFRDPLVFEIVASLLRKLVSKRSDLRIWSAGCAAGEETYSLAILVKDALRLQKVDSGSALVFGTDIDPKSIAAAQNATYSRESLGEMKLRHFDSWFSLSGQKYTVDPAIRAMVHFSREDLLNPGTVAPAESIFGSFDLILCRNVLIYFSQSHQAQILSTLCSSLSEGGYLVLGSSEEPGPDLRHRLTVIDARNKVYQK